ncbi:MAG: 50S ribosomal protein L3 [bacterium]
MKYILGIKQNMTQVFDENGIVYPVTVVKTTPNVVTQVKTKDRDGYEALQVGFGVRKEKNINKAQLGQFKDLGLFQFVREIRTGEAKNVGDALDLSQFTEGEKITITSVSKGKGFQGVVKRHGFHGGPRSHGQKHSEREPGSISGGNREGGRVPKGMRMAGRMGGDIITVKNLKVVQIDSEKGEILIKGAVPGRRGTLVEIKA